ncbi:MAG: thiamine pyrophosphate-binding protein [Legionellaceae bacterium]|nr:thiamine pyrophosphate-binding protein [Legionellaceae bacterium]
MQNVSVAVYVAQRLSDLGLDHVFGVPGDYAFPFDDAIEVVSKLTWVACANELNAAYAADGYGRRFGAAILSTTYGVGELSALNGVMGCLAHRVPVFHIVGAPSRRIVHQGIITHHTLGDGVYGNFEALSGSACCVSTVLTPENTIREMERVIEEAIGQSKPAYIVIPEDYGKMAVIGKPIQGKPLSQIVRRESIQVEVDVAVDALIKAMQSAKNVVVLPSMLVKRFGLETQLVEFLTKSKLSFALTPMDKGVVSETLPGYMGIYNGFSSYPAEVSSAVESADLILDLGGVIFEDLNTGFWSDKISQDRIVRIRDTWVQIGDKVWVGTCLHDVLNGLIAKVSSVNTIYTTLKPQALEMIGVENDLTGSAVFYPRIQNMLRAGDVLVAETGTCMLHLGPLLLPEGVGYESQVLWGSIGWATPAALGVAMANKKGRTVLVTGDGSHQLTYNEVAVMGRYQPKIAIFVLNNGIFGIEDVLSEMGHEYDNLAAVKYHLIPDAMGCQGWITGRVTTVAELDEAIKRIETSDAPAYIEVMIPAEESQPISGDKKDQLYKLQTPKA